jgi:CelD/BcsL family acetyltransferase involved in cellulose biosynthesis
MADETVGSDYLDVLVDPELDIPVRRALWTEALSLAGRAYDVLELREMLRDGPSASMLGELAAGSGLETETQYRCPHIAISGTFADFIQGVSRADNLKRRKKQLEKMPGFAIDVARTEAEVGPALDTFFHLHALRWAADGGSQGITGKRIEAFHRECVRRFAREDRVRLYTLRIEDHALASVYMLGKGSTRYFYQSGYDPAHSKLSPGLVLLARTIEDAFEEGAREYDFLHGSEPYKFEWATGERQTMALRLTVPNLRGRWRSAERSAVAAARALGQKVLGERYDLLRQLRRRWAVA